MNHDSGDTSTRFVAWAGLFLTLASSHGGRAESQTSPPRATSPPPSTRIVYDGRLGTLPSAQGWVYYSEDPKPPDGLDRTQPRRLEVGFEQPPTGGPSQDDGNYQWHEIAGETFDFDRDRIEISVRLRIASATRSLGPDKRAGFGVWLVDSEGERVAFFAGEEEIFLVGSKRAPFERIPIDTRARFRDYTLHVGAGQATLSVDGRRHARLPRGDFARAADHDVLLVGDVTKIDRASFAIERMSLEIFRPSGPRAPAARAPAEER